MKFHRYIALREADQTQEIDQIFNKAAADIKGLFDQLYKGTAGMVRNYEKASLPEEIQKQILQDLSRLAQKVKGMNTTKMSDPRGEGQPTENVVINSFLNHIVENINYVIKETEASPSIVQDMGSHGKGIGGKSAFDFKSTITNTYRLVMDAMSRLKDAVFQHMGIVRDTHSKVLGLRNTAGQIRNKVTGLDDKISAGFDKLSNQPQPFSGNEEDKAQDSIIALANAVNGGFGVKLKGSDGTEIAIDPKSSKWHQQVLKLGQRDKRFKLVGPDGQEEDVNIGNPSQVHQALSGLGYSGTSDFVPQSRGEQPEVKLSRRRITPITNKNKGEK